MVRLILEATSRHLKDERIIRSQHDSHRAFDSLESCCDEMGSLMGEGRAVGVVCPDLVGCSS